MFLLLALLAFVSISSVYKEFVTMVHPWYLLMEYIPNLFGRHIYEFGVFLKLN